MAATVAAQLSALVEIVNQLKERAEEDRTDLKEYHDKLHYELASDREHSDIYRTSVQKDLAKLAEGQKNILRRVDAIEPVTTMVTSFRAKLAGAVIVLGFLGSVVIWVLIYFREQITKAWIP